MLFNPLLPEMRTDPYPAYHPLRAADPVHRVSFEVGPEVWILSRYRDVATLLRSPQGSSDRRKSDLYEAFLQALPEELRREELTPSMLFLDPPDHTRLRSLVNQDFTGRVIGQAPSADRADGGCAAGWDGRSGQRVSPRPDRRAPVPPGLGPPLRPDRGGDEGGRLSEAELVSTCGLLLIAGHETTSGLIGNGTLALLRNASELGRWHEEPGLSRFAVEELLRYDSPVQLTGRLLVGDLDVDGRVLPQGSEVVGLLGAANRDPAQFPDPDRLDLGRTENRHVAFGSGIHFCLGAALARVEGQVPLGQLVRRFPEMSLAGDPVWRDTVTLRGLRSLPVSLG